MTNSTKVWKRGWKRPLTVAQIASRRRGGQAVLEKYGPEHFVELREKSGGRPTFMESVKKAHDRGAARAASRPRPGRVSKKEEQRLTPHPVERIF